MTTDTSVTDRLDELDSLTGTGTQLVSVTIPPEKSLTSIQQRIADEYASAEHIKKDETRRNVQDALKRIQRLLRQYTETPENGLAVYAGSVDDSLVSETIDELPAPIGASTYTCDSQFTTQPVRDIVDPQELVGLVIIERGGAAIGELRGGTLNVLHTFDSMVMGKTKAGGQSAQRFARERERQTHEFFQRVAKRTRAEFVDAENFIGLAVGGTLGTAKRFVSNDYLGHPLQDSVLETFSIEYGNETGLRQLATAAEPLIEEAEQQIVTNHLDTFWKRLKDDENVTYGRSCVETAIEYHAVDTLLISSRIDSETRQTLQENVEQQGGTVVEIPETTAAGTQFREVFGGIGALLRFDLD